MSNPTTAITDVQSCIRSLDTAMDTLKESLDAPPSGGVSRSDRDHEIHEWIAHNFDISEHNLLDEDEVQSKCEYEAESAVDNIDWSDKIGSEVDEAVENIDWNSKFNDHLDLQKEMDDWACNVYLTKGEIIEMIETVTLTGRIVFPSEDNVQHAASGTEASVVKEAFDA